MPAEFDIMLDRGGSDGSPGNSDILTNLRFRTDDDNIQDTTNPVPIIAGQTRRSFWRQVYLKCTTAPVTKVDNVKFFTDGGGYGTGITLQVAEQFLTKNSGGSTGYKLAVGSVGESGDEVVANHAGVSSVVDAFTKIVGSPLSGPSISEAGNLIDAIGETTNYLVFQADVVETASSGVKGAELFTLQYDEI